MEETIQQLEAKLKEAKKAEIKKYLDERLGEFKEKYEGKVFSSHRLCRSTLLNTSKRNISTTVQLIRVKKVSLGYDLTEINEGNVSSDWTVDTLKGMNLTAVVKCELVQIYCAGESREYEVKVNHEYKTNLHWNRSAFRYEQTNEMFENIINMCENGIIDLCQSSSKILGNPEFSVHRGAKEYSQLEELHKAGVKTVKLDPNGMYWMSNHPFLYVDEIIVSQQSVDIVQKWLDECNRIIANTRSFEYGDEYISAYAMCELDRRKAAVYESVIKKLKEAL